MRFEYDVIVIGAGHAGCEAAVAAARMGCATLLITKDLNRVAQMSCNPAIGGIAKGQIVREIDALGGMMGIIADRTAIQFRMLNRSKGPAVWSPRVQSDRTKYIDAWRQTLDSTPNLYLFQDNVDSLLIEKPGDANASQSHLEHSPAASETGADGALQDKREDIPAASETIAGSALQDEREDSPAAAERRDGGKAGGGTGKAVVRGVRTSLGFEFRGKQVVLTAGTFLNGLMHFGATKLEGGRISEDASKGLTEQLKEIGFTVGRMKTGTPARIDGRTIDFTLAERQDGDELAYEKFSFLPEVRRVLPSRPCWIVHTNPEAHKLMTDRLSESPLYNGDIQSIGPRYCPSIETKLVTFKDKESHQLFLEPEGETTEEYYVNGFSSSMPWDVQLGAMQCIPALRDVHFYRPGYAIEYDFFEPTQLTHDLQTKLVEGLYFAGQVNGTTGYEEAAAQGLMAGINAARRTRGETPVVLGRDEAYIGVLIDDLVTKGVDEPYRMFTSRAEYRILLRQDDADMRLTPVGFEIGLADARRHRLMLEKKEARDALIEWAGRFSVKISPEINAYLLTEGTTPLSASVRLVELLRRPQLGFGKLMKVLPRLAKRLEELPEDRREEIVQAAEILIKYEGYIKRERDLADKQTRTEHVRIPEGFDFMGVGALSTEARQKLERIRPKTVGQASRIPGVSPADINVLLLLLGR